MSDSTLDLDAYFERIRYSGLPGPNLATLRNIQLRHSMSIPFENLDVLLKRPIRLDLDSLQRKLIQEKRGGYCFEQNALLAAVLRELGFDVTPLSARVRWKVPEGVATPHTHMLLLVTLAEGPFIVDVGFGGLTPTTPLALDNLEAQQTTHEDFRLQRGGDYELQARIGNDWKSVYRFTTERRFPVDYEVANWYVSTHPQSVFTGNLIASRPDADRRYNLLNGRLSIRYRDGSVDQRPLSSFHDAATALERHFLLPQTNFPDRDAFRAVIESKLATGA